MKNKKGFTLVELIAVIVLLGLLAILITPKITETIKKQKKAIFTSSVEGIVDTISKDITDDSSISTDMAQYRAYDFDVNKLYLIVEDDMSKDESIKISGKIKNGAGRVVVTDVDKIALAITDGKYCAKKSPTERDIVVTEMKAEDKCELEEGIFIEGSSCFIYEENPDGTLTITGYDYNNSSCPKDLVIPNRINGKTVSKIKEGAFFDYDRENYKLVAVYKHYIKDNSGNIIDTYWLDEFYEKLPENADISYYYLTSNSDDTLKTNNESEIRPSILNGISSKDSNIENLTSLIKPARFCYNISTGTETLVDIDYVDTSTDDYDFCYLEADYYSLENMYKFASIDFSKNYNITKIPNLLIPGAGLSSVKFGSSITDTGISAFENNNISSLNISSNISKISNSSFGDNLLTQVNFASAKSLESIGEYAFYSNSIEILDISSATNLTLIDDGAFEYNSITTISYPSNLVEIDDYAFYSNDILEFDFLGLTKIKRIGEKAFYENFPENGTVDFSECSSLQEIDDYAFWRTYINNVVFGNIPLINIGEGALGHNNLDSMEVIDLSGLTSLRSIGDIAFANGWSDINNKFILPNGITTFGEGALGDHPVSNGIYMLKGTNDYTILSSHLTTEYTSYIMTEDDTYYIFTVVPEDPI